MSARAAVDRLRRIGAQAWLEPATALVLRASTVRGSAGFVAREVLRRRQARAYELRRNGFTAVIRHATPDVVTLGEVFHRPDYAIPAQVARLLGPVERPLRVLDLGANIGLFGLFVLGERPQATVHAFEPDAANAAVLRWTIELNRLSGRWLAVEAAAGAYAGEVAFDGGRYALSRIGGKGDTRVEMVDVLPAVAEADLLKMDIEGGEWAIVGDPRFQAAPPRSVVLEYHPHMAPEGTSPRVAMESRLRECGYELQPIFHRADGHGMLWGWRS